MIAIEWKKLEQVLEALEVYATSYSDGDAAITAIKEALAQPEQEPVFKWCSVFQEMPTKDSHLLFCFGVHVVEGSYTKKGWASLAYGEAQPDFWAYMPPPPHHKRNQELYAIPPKRPWVGLTAQEAADCWTTSATQTWHNFEAALRSKNI